MEEPIAATNRTSWPRLASFSGPISAMATVAGVLLVLCGAAIQPESLVGSLRPGITELPARVHAQLLAGAQLFRIGLASSGIVLIGLPLLPGWRTAPATRTVAGAKGHRYEVLVLGALLVAALILRLISLGSGLWFDEILTQIIYLRVPFIEAVTTYEAATKNQHFLYTAAAHASFLLFGDNPAALRLPAVLFGVGSIWALYLFCREVSGRREAFLTAALLTFSYHHVWFSQNARGYTALLFWTLLSSLCLVRGLRESRNQIWLLYALSVALGTFAHLTMLFVAAAHFLTYLGVLLLARGKEGNGWWRGTFLGFGLGGLITLCLHALVLPQLLGGEIKDPSTVRAWTNPLASMLELAEGRPSWMIGLAMAGSVVGLVVFGAGLLSFARTQPVVIPLAVLPILLTVVAAVAMGQYMLPRHFFHTAGIAALVVVRGVLVLCERAAVVVGVPDNRKSVVSAIPAAGLVLLSALTIPPVYGPKQDYAGAFAFVQEQRQAGDAVAVAGLAAMPFLDLYRADWLTVETSGELDALRTSASRTWLVYTLPIEMKALYPDILASAERDFVLVRRFDGTLGGGTVYIWRTSESNVLTSPHFERGIPAG